MYKIVWSLSVRSGLFLALVLASLIQTRNVTNHVAYQNQLAKATFFIVPIAKTSVHNINSFASTVIYILIEPLVHCRSLTIFQEFLVESFLWWLYKYLIPFDLLVFFVFSPDL